VSQYQVGPETYVTLEFSVRDAEGESVAQASRLSFVFGRGQLLPVLERAVDGLSAGEKKSVTIDARDAYGKRDPKAMIEVDRSEFPDDVAPGDHFEVENEHGNLLVLRVLEVLSDAVVVDMNHPLAGQDIVVDVEILDVRPATSAELAEAEALLEEGVSLDAEARAHQQEPSAGLLSIDSLLRGRTRGYEENPVGSSNPDASHSGDADEQ
jgi:FKBP-type peptidyl-prolyl cis-trans isomerase SlyD